MRVETALTLPLALPPPQTPAPPGIIPIRGGGANTPTKPCTTTTAPNRPLMLNQRGAQLLPSGADQVAGRNLGPTSGSAQSTPLGPTPVWPLTQGQEILGADDS